MVRTLHSVVAAVELFDAPIVVDDEEPEPVAEVAVVPEEDVDSGISEVDEVAWKMDVVLDATEGVVVDAGVIEGATAMGVDPT